MNKHKIGIVGSGISDLSTCYQLQKAGIKPVIFESNDRPGGRMYSVQDGDFLFDLGTIAPMGGMPVTEELVTAANLSIPHKHLDTMIVGMIKNGMLHRIDSAHLYPVSSSWTD